MFKAELSDSSILKTSFDAISSIVDEVQIQTDSEGMRLDALDRSHITLMNIFVMFLKKSTSTLMNL